MSDEKPRDFEGTELNTGDEIVFTATGYLCRGRILFTYAPGGYGGMLVQSLVSPARTCVVSPACSVLIHKAAQP